MKRSEINAVLNAAKRTFAAHHFFLPPWATWSPDDWRHAGPKTREIRDAMLGWDVTDFGLGNFTKAGLLLFTLRNGAPGNRKPYAEKIMIVQPRQITPMHFHWVKMEDIINRGGGQLVIQLYNSLPDEELDKTSPVKVSIDGIAHMVAPGGCVRLEPGQSITLTQRLYHEFWAERDTCMIGEVSLVNDDTGDNRFYRPVGRFPRIEEDEPPLHLLCSDPPEMFA